MMLERRIVARALLALVLLAPGFARASVPSLTVGRPHRTLPRLTLAEPVPVRVRANTRATGTQTYSLVDDGAPAPAYVLSNPVAFNNSGQIAGNAFDAIGTVHCMLYDGKHYRDLSSAKSLTGCIVDGMNDEATSGDVDVVGYGSTRFSGYTSPYDYDSKAIFSTTNVKSGLVRTSAYPNDGAMLTGVNAVGKAIGLGAYAPATGFPVAEAPMTVTQQASVLSVLQPACSTLHAGCAAYDNGLSDSDAPCGFGGCQIASDGTILLTDLFSGYYETIAPGGVTRDIALDANMQSVPIINNSGQLLYSVDTIVRGVPVVQTQLYTLATGSVVKVPTIAGNSCTQYVPISFNDAGAILGYTTNCSSGDYSFFVFAPATGTLNLTAELPSGDYALQPYGINDSGRILTAIFPSTGANAHWGYLAPATAVAARDRRPVYVTAADGARSTPARAAGGSGVPRAHPPAPSALESLAAAHRPALALGARPIHLRANALLVAGQTYTIVDVGAPPTGSYTLQAPVAFNNTGQIVGTATNIPFATSTTCVLFDGSRFRNITASPTVVNCNPMSMNDLDKGTGSLNVVGRVISAFSLPGDTKAFESKITPKTSFVGTTVFLANDSSDLTGINAGGLAVGVGFYIRQPPTIGAADSILFASPGKQSLAPLTAACGASGYCGDIFEKPCAFGGCEVTADGTLYLQRELVDPDGSISPLKLDPNAVYPIINNAKQLLYWVESSDVAGQAVYYASPVRIYQIGTGVVTTIYKLQNNTCRFYYPLSFNNEGQVLGYTDDCTNPADATYFTYDSVNGTQDLLAELPPGNVSVTPTGINDNGQILTALTLPGGAIHWGILAPPAASSARRRRFACAYANAKRLNLIPL